MRRRIAVLSTSRADYSHLRWPLEALSRHPDLQPELVVTAAHLSPEFGCTVREIEADGIPVAHRVEALLSSDTDVGMAKTIGVAVLGLADLLGRLRPDILLLIADRYEMLAPACVALALRIPVAHIEGGEVSEGAIDDAVRNALTKLSHLHFVPTRRALKRVVAMGEESWRVHQTGAPSLDHLRQAHIPRGAELARLLGGAVDPGSLLVAWHPVTIHQDTLQETEALFQALEAWEHPLIFSFPNADAGSRELVSRCRALCRRRRGSRLFQNLPAPVWWGLLQEVAVLVGNSSSGIMESPSVALPTVNVGLRQQGRERARNIIDAAASRPAILEALERASAPGFRSSLEGLVNPYGDGRASEGIARVLATAPLGEALLLKKACP